MALSNHVCQEEAVCGKYTRRVVMVGPLIPAGANMRFLPIRNWSSIVQVCLSSGESITKGLFGGRHVVCVCVCVCVLARMFMCVSVCLCSITHTGTKDSTGGAQHSTGVQNTYRATGIPVRDCVSKAVYK